MQRASLIICLLLLLSSAVCCPFVPAFAPSSRWSSASPPLGFSPASSLPTPLLHPRLSSLLPTLRTLWGRRSPEAGFKQCPLGLTQAEAEQRSCRYSSSEERLEAAECTRRRSSGGRTSWEHTQWWPWLRRARRSPWLLEVGGLSGEGGFIWIIWMMRLGWVESSSRTQTRSRECRREWRASGCWSAVLSRTGSYWSGSRERSRSPSTMRLKRPGPHRPRVGRSGRGGSGSLRWWWPFQASWCHSRWAWSRGRSEAVWGGFKPLLK